MRRRLTELKRSLQLMVMVFVLIFAVSQVGASDLVIESTKVAKGTVVLNGRLNEWQIGTPADLGEICFIRNADNDKGYEVDLAGAIFSMWDDEYLYFAGSIEDDDLVYHEVDWASDRWAFLLNTRPGGTSVEEIADVAAPKFIPGHHMFTYRLFWTAFGDDGVLAATSPTDEGYNFEVRIPWSSIAKLENKPYVGLEYKLIILITDWQEGWAAAPEAVWGADWTELWQWDNMGTLRLVDAPEE
jgi:hypothetical protein